jgi:hypothetical protein
MAAEVAMRRWMVVVGLLGVIAGCADGNSDGGVADSTGLSRTTAVATTSPTTVATAPTTPPIEASSWQRLDPADEAIPGGMGRVVEGGPGFVAVGADGSGGDFDAAVWTSVDGYVWERVAHDEAVFGGPGDQVMQGLAAGGPGFVAAGFDTDRGVVVWTSTDGLVWTRIVDLGGLFAQDVAVGDDILVVVGMDEGADGSQIAAVWTSPDGLAWTRVPHDEDVFGGDGNQAVNAVAHGVSGFVAVGYEFEQASPDFDAAVWVSPDGGSWSRVPHDEEVFGGDGWQGMETVHAGPSGLVALGYGDSGDDSDDGYDVAVWTSIDGTDWVRVPHDEDVLGGAGEQVVRDVAAGEVGLVAVGRDAASGDDDAAIWISTDGAAWTQLNDETFGGSGDQEMRGVTVLADRIIAVGTDRVTGEPTAVVWVGYPQVADGPGPDIDAPGQAPSESTPTAEDSKSDPAAAEAALNHAERAIQFNAILGAEGFPGLALDEGDLLGPEPELNTIENFDVPFENDAARGHVTFAELEEVAGGEWAMVMIVDELFDENEGAAWVDAAIQGIIRMLEPALPDIEVEDLAADLMAADDYYEEVGSSIFIAHGNIADLPLELVGAEAMVFTYSDRFDGIAPTAVDPGAITLSPIMWATEADDWGLAIIVEVSPVAPWDVEDMGARLIWEDTTITLCNSRLQPSECTAAPYIAIRKAGDDYLHIGDILGFYERPELEDAAAQYGPPTTVCIYVTVAGVTHEYCAPLEVDND